MNNWFHQCERLYESNQEGRGQLSGLRIAQQSQLLWYAYHKLQFAAQGFFCTSFALERQDGLILRYVAQATIKFSSISPNRAYDEATKILVKLLRQRGYQFTLDELYEIVAMDDNGMIGVLILIISDKGKNAKKCLICGEKKNMVFNMSEQIFSRHRKIWSYINLILNKEVLYDSSVPDDLDAGDLDISQLLSIDQMKDLFTFAYIQGAERVLLEFQIKSNSIDISTLNVEAAIDVSSVQKNKPQSVITRELTSQDLAHVQKKDGHFVRELEFYNMRSNGEHKRNDLDGLVYTRVTVHIFSHGKSLDFHFAIRGYHELIRYKIEITINEQNKQLHAKVQDADYEFKHALFAAGQ